MYLMASVKFQTILTAISLSLMVTYNNDFLPLFLLNAQANNKTIITKLTSNFYQTIKPVFLPT